MSNAEQQERPFTKQDIINHVNEYEGDIESAILYIADGKIATMAVRMSPISFMRFLEVVAKEDPRLSHAIKAMAVIL